MITNQDTLADVVKDLNEVAPYDWKSFLEKRVYDLHPPVPMNGFTQGGYKLVYTDNPTEWAAKDLTPSVASSSGQDSFVLDNIKLDFIQHTLR